MNLVIAYLIVLILYTWGVLLAGRNETSYDIMTLILGTVGLILSLTACCQAITIVAQHIMK